MLGAWLTGFFQVILTTPVADGARRLATVQLPITMFPLRTNDAQRCDVGLTLLHMIAATPKRSSLCHVQYPPYAYDHSRVCIHITTTLAAAYAIQYMCEKKVKTHMYCIVYTAGSL